MSARTNSNLEPEPSSLPLRMRLATASAWRGVELVPRENAAAGEIPTIAGCLRGVCWGLAIEGAAGLLFYAMLRLVLGLH
jgi:hypothetical protein